MPETLKEPYEAPQVTRIKLAAEEMAAGACKRSVSSRGSFSTCLRPGNPCLQSGS